MNLIQNIFEEQKNNLLTRSISETFSMFHYESNDKINENKTKFESYISNLNIYIPKNLKTHDFTNNSFLVKRIILQLNILFMEEYHKLLIDTKDNKDKQIYNFVYSFGANVSNSLRNTIQDILSDRSSIELTLTESISEIELIRTPLMI
jgi:hypothetical protein